MAVAKTIRVNLTLDDQGFITKVQDANGKITALKQTFAKAGKAAESMEGNLGKVRDASKNASLAVSSFGKSFEGAKASITKLAESARDMRKDLNSIAANTEAVTGKFRGLAQSAGAVERNFRDIALSTGRLAGDLVKLDVVAKSASKLIRQMGSDARAVANDMKTLKASVASMNSSTSAIDAAVRRANAAITDFTHHMQRMNQVAAATGRSQAAVARSVEETGMSFHNWIWTLGMAREAAFTLFDVFLRAPIAIVQTNAELERMQKLFEGMSDKQTRSERQADGVATKNKIMDMSLTMPFDVKTLTDAAVKLKSGGIDPLNGSLKTLGDAVAYFGGTSDQFHRAAIAIQQMSGKGVISMEELRQQLGEAVPTAMQSMATAMGYTMAELTDKVSKGQVAAKSALSKMLAQMELEMGGAGERMMQTWSGMWEGFKSRMVMFQEQIGKTGFFEEMRSQLSGLLNAMDEGKLQGFASAIGEGLSKVVAELNDMLSRAGPLLDALVNGLRMVGGVTAVVWDALKQLASALSAVERTTGLVSAAMYTWISMSVANKVAGMISAVVRLGTVSATTAGQTAALTAAQTAANTAVAAGTTSSGLLAGALARMGGAATAAGAGMAAFGRGLLALTVTGGPIVVLTAAIGLAIGKMIEWANTAEETTNRVRLAAGGQAQGWKNGDEWKRDYDDLKESQRKTLDARRKYLSDLDELRKAERAYGADDNYTRNVRAKVEESKKAYQDLTASHERLKLAYKNNNIKTYTDKNADRTRSLQLHYDAGEEDYRNRMVDRQIKFRESDAFKGMNDRQRAQTLAKIEADSSAAYINALTGLLNKTKDAAERKIIEGKISKIKAQMANYQAQIPSPNDLTAGKKNGTAPATIQDDSSPLEEMLGKLEAEAAEAEAGFKMVANRIREVGKLRAEAEAEALKAFLGGSLDKEIAQRQGKTKVGKMTTPDREAAFKSFGKELTDAIEKQKVAEAQLRAIEKAQSDLDKSTIALTESNEAFGKQLDSAPLTKYRLAMEEMAKQLGLSGEKLEKFNAIWKQTLANNATTLVNRQIVETKDRLEELVERARKVGEDMRDRAQADSARAYSARKKELDRQRAEAEALKRVRAGEAGAGAQLAQLRAEQERERTEERRLELQERRNRQREREIELDKRVQAVAKARQKAEDDIDAAIKNGAGSSKIAAIRAAREKEINLTAGKYDHFDKLMDRWSTGADRLQYVWIDAIEGMKASTADFLDDAVNGLTDMAMGGSLSFSRMRDSVIKSFGDIAESVIKDIIRMNMQMLIQRAIMSSMGMIGGSFSMPNLLPPNAFAKGGAFASAGIQAFADGGAFTNKIASVPTVAPMALFGEAGPEAIMPLGRASNGELGVRVVGGDGGKQTQVVVNVINTSGQQVAAEQRGAPRFDGKQMILDVVLSAVNSPGSFREGMRAAVK